MAVAQGKVCSLSDRAQGSFFYSPVDFFLCLLCGICFPAVAVTYLILNTTVLLFALLSFLTAWCVEGKYFLNGKKMALKEKRRNASAH